MTSQPRSSENLRSNIDERFPRIEEHGKHVIDYLNDYIIPQLRRSSSQAVRAAARRLTCPAEQPDRRHGSSLLR